MYLLLEICSVTSRVLHLYCAVASEIAVDFQINHKTMSTLSNNHIQNTGTYYVLAGKP